MQCGAQIFVVQTVDPADAARMDRERLLRKYKLNKIQLAILSAAAGAEGDQDIYVCGSGQRVVGEVKSGGKRFEGNEAVAAVAGLAGPGLISPHGDDCFRLTLSGARLAKSLHEPES